jgi:hypothetical protein
MAAKKLTVGNSPMTNTIFAGTLLKDGRTWGANKQDVTIDALSAVISHCMQHQERYAGEKVALTGGDTTYVISVEKVIAP